MKARTKTKYSIKRSSTLIKIWWMHKTFRWCPILTWFIIKTNVKSSLQKGRCQNFLEFSCELMRRIIVTILQVYTPMLVIMLLIYYNLLGVKMLLFYIPSSIPTTIINLVLFYIYICLDVRLLSLHLRKMINLIIGCLVKGVLDKNKGLRWIIGLRLIILKS